MEMISNYEPALAKNLLRFEKKKKKSPDAPFTLVPFNRLKPGTGTSHLVKGLIPRVGIVAVWGPPKCGKSFWAFDLAMHSALGWEYRNRRRRSGAIRTRAMSLRIATPLTCAVISTSPFVVSVLVSASLWGVLTTSEAGQRCGACEKAVCNNSSYDIQDF